MAETIAKGQILAVDFRPPVNEPTMEAARIQLNALAEKYGGAEMYDEMIEQSDNLFSIVWKRKSDG